MRLLTYNIHGCVGMDRREDPDRILRVIHGIDADVIALQEVDRRDASDRCVIKALQSSGTHQVLYGPTLRRGGGAYGNLLLSRFPIVEHHLLDLSVPGREPRGAVCAVLDHGHGKIALGATHLGLGMRERRDQVNRLIVGLTQLAVKHDADLELLLGDFNEWLVPGRPLRWLRRYFGGAHARRTFPAALPLLKLDRIWVKPTNRLRSLETVRSSLTREASDHLPLVAEIDLETRRFHGCRDRLGN